MSSEEVCWPAGVRDNPSARAKSSAGAGARHLRCKLSGKLPNLGQVDRVCGNIMLLRPKSGRCVAAF